MSVQIRKATRKKAKLRLGIAAPSGAGKTYSSLLLAFGLGGKVGLVDTENGSGDLYAHLGDYDVITLGPPYTAQSYIDAIHAFERSGYDVIIVDSLSHAWAGEGGMLDKQGKIADRTKNSYTAWREVTPDHNALVNAMLSSSAHIIATMRSKQEYAQEKDDNGKTRVKKLGLAPVQREGMEYEMTVMFDIDSSHVASASKDRTDMFRGQYFTITKDTGKKLLAWLDAGVDEFGNLIAALNQVNSSQTLDAAKASAKVIWATLTQEQRDMVSSLVAAADLQFNPPPKIEQPKETQHEA